MDIVTKFACFFLLFIFPFRLSSQAPPAPSNLSASYKKYVNRIELRWDVSTARLRYIIKRRERSAKAFFPLDTVDQNRYVDRNNLQINTEYIYHVQALGANGEASPPSGEAVGALLSIAGGNRDPQADEPELLESCLQIQALEAKISAGAYGVRFQAKSSCASYKQAQLFLYYSTDALPDENDQLLNRQVFDLKRARGALSGPYTGDDTKGYFILKAVADNSLKTVVFKANER